MVILKCHERLKKMAKNTLSNVFSNTAIESLTIPSSVTELKYNWSHMTPYLIKIDVMPGNKRYKMHKHDFLIGKTDPEIDKFYDLLFAR